MGGCNLFGAELFESLMKFLFQTIRQWKNHKPSAGQPSEAQIFRSLVVRDLLSRKRKSIAKTIPKKLMHIRQQKLRLTF